MAMIRAYWLIGREIVEVEQAGEQRAGYGQNVIERLSARLKRSFGRGFSVQNLGYMRQFCLTFPQGSALPEIRQALPGELREGAIRQALPGGSGGRAGARGPPAWCVLRPIRRHTANRRLRRCSHQRSVGRITSS
jgi:hypothetical protein